MRLVEATTTLLAKEGGDAEPARKVATAVGLSHQIVHYYVKPMDDLLMAIVEHGMAEALTELEQAMATDHPLRAVAKLNSSLLAVAMCTEMTICAHDKPALRLAMATPSSASGWLSTGFLSAISRWALRGTPCRRLWPRSL